MIGLDTNVLVRYVTQDDPVQSAKASELIESLTTLSPGFVSLVSVRRDQRMGCISAMLAPQSTNTSACSRSS